MQRSSKIILALIALAALFFIIGRAVIKPDPPDTQQIQNQIQVAVSAAQSKNAGGVASILSDNYQDDNGNNPTQMRVLLGRGFQNVDGLDVSVSPAQITVNGDQAQSSFYLTVRGNGHQMFNQLIQLNWAKEPTHKFLVIPSHEWKVVKASYGSLPDAL